MKNYFGVLTMSEALEARGYTIKEKPEDLSFDIVAERNGMVEFFLVEEDKHRVWNRREDYEEETVSFNSQSDEIQGESFWYVIVCTATKSFIIAHSSETFKEKYLDGNSYTLPNDKCFIINYKEFADVST